MHTCSHAHTHSPLHLHTHTRTSSFSLTAFLCLSHTHTHTQHTQAYLYAQTIQSGWGRKGGGGRGGVVCLWCMPQRHTHNIQLRLRCIPSQTFRFFSFPPPFFFTVTPTDHNMYTCILNLQIMYTYIYEQCVCINEVYVNVRTCMHL